MFTGLVTDVGTVQTIETTSSGSRVSIKTSYPIEDLVMGESIAVDGACLTVVAIGTESFDVEASPETLRLTTLGDRSAGDHVHLERALRFSDRLGGHLVLGHVDGVGHVQSVSRDGNAIILSISTPDTVSPYLLPKGSITVNGVSLTLNQVFESSFEIAIIPHTQDETTLAAWTVGDRVNLEADVIGKYVRRMLAGGGSPGGIDLETLASAGFKS